MQTEKRIGVKDAVSQPWQTSEWVFEDSKTKNLSKEKHLSGRTNDTGVGEFHLLKLSECRLCSSECNKLRRVVRGCQSYDTYIDNSGAAEPLDI